MTKITTTTTTTPTKQNRERKKSYIRNRLKLLTAHFTSYCSDSNHFCTISFQDSTHESLHIIPVQQIKDIEIVKDVSVIIIPLCSNDT